MPSMIAFCISRRSLRCNGGHHCRLTGTWNSFRLGLLLLLLLCCASSTAVLVHADNIEGEVPHPDLNQDNHAGMVYLGRLDSDGHRVSAATDNTVRYLFGSSFAPLPTSTNDSDGSNHHTHLMEGLRHTDKHPHDGPPGHEKFATVAATGNHPHTHETHHAHHKPLKSRRDVLEDRARRNATTDGPVPFGHVETHAADGGRIPLSAVAVPPFWLDETPVTNRAFAKFVQSVYHVTEAEHFGWSFVLEPFVTAQANATRSRDHGPHESDPDAPHWVAVPGAYWRAPEGPGSSYRHREDHPVVHVSHRDAADYCAWRGRSTGNSHRDGKDEEDAGGARLPGEREYEAAARWCVNEHDTHGKASNTTSGDAATLVPCQWVNRTMYAWSNDNTHDPWDTAAQHANLWGPDGFPHSPDRRDGWQTTSPVRTYPPNAAGVYDTTGNVWEWMRGGTHGKRILRGASFADTLDGTTGHTTAATLGARTIAHGTTTAQNIGFRCARAGRTRVRHHYVYESRNSRDDDDDDIYDDDSARVGRLAVQDESGRLRRPEGPKKADSEEEEERDGHVDELIKKKVVYKHETLMTEL